MLDTLSPPEWLRLNWEVPALERASSLSLLLSGGLPLVDIGLVLERPITTENDSALKISEQGTSQAARPGPFFPLFLLEKRVGIRFAQPSISSLESGQYGRDLLSSSTPELVLACPSCLTVAKVVFLHCLISPTSDI